MPVTQDTPDYIQHPPHAYRITSDEEAISIAHEIAAYLQPGAAERDLSGVVPPEVVDTFSNSGLWGITIPREYGGAEVSAATLAAVIAIISAADPALGQIPQNHYCLLEDIRLQGSDEQRRFFFELALSGHRFANALSETGGKTVQDLQTRLTRTAEGLRINGRKGYCTGSLYAHWLGVLALDEEGRAQLAFVPRRAPGLTVVNDWACLGQRTTSSGTVLVDNLPVEPFNLIASWKSYDTPTLAGPFAQLTTAAIDAGIARAALNDTVSFVNQFARPWIDAGVERAGDDPLTIYQIGVLDSRIAAAEALLEQAGKVLDRYKHHLSERRWRWLRSPWRAPKSLPPKPRWRPLHGCLSWGERVQPIHATTSIATGVMAACARCTILCAGNTTCLATGFSTARLRRVTTGTRRDHARFSR